MLSPLIAGARSRSAVVKACVLDKRGRLHFRADHGYPLGHHVAGGMFMDASVQIMGKTLHVWASSDVGISGAYWTRVWDGNAWR